MSTRGENTAIVGVGVAACALCCAGPILGFLAAIGLTTAISVALLGTIGLGIGALGIALLLRRRRGATACTPSSEPVAVAAPTLRSSR